MLVGRWDRGSGTFFAEGQEATFGRTTSVLNMTVNPALFNAVQVRGGADGQYGHNQMLDVWFSVFLGGRQRFGAAAGAVAISGGACSDTTGCTLPFAVPSCALFDAGGTLACGTTMTLDFNHGHGKQIALADTDRANPHNPTPPLVIAAEHGAQTCTNSDVAVGDSVNVGNGNDFNGHVEDALHGPDLDLVCTAPPPYTGCPRRQIPVVDIADCSAPMNQARTVVGFTRVVIVGTDTHGSTRSITVYLECGGPTPAVAMDCGYYGFGERKLRLVK